ncbi:MAG: histidinol-phosphatase [Tannerellaceae bacterium]
MQDSNFHSHCTYCDGHAETEAFVKSAIDKQFRAYGFSSHSPLPFRTIWNMNAEDMDTYIKEVNDLKHKYANEIEIYCGLEIDYLSDQYNASSAYFTSLPLDYRIGSLHFITQDAAYKELVCIDGPFSEFKQNVDEYYGGDVQALIKHYYESMSKMVVAGCFDFVGHLDKIYMNASGYKEFDVTSKQYTSQVIDLLHLIKEHDQKIEINTKVLNKKSMLFPHQQFFDTIKQLEIPLMVNSDSHYPELVNDGRAEVLELLKEAGIKTTVELSQGEWKEFEIK